LRVAPALFLVYHESKMRRALSILMILFFGLGPLAATLSADEDSHLPACCRRQGAHHCAMSPQMAAQMAEMATEADPGTPAVKAPATCPYFPGYTVASSTTNMALATAPVSLPALIAELHSPAATRTSARISQMRTRADRGPPAYSLA
jgi:hypothetical protein